MIYFDILLQHFELSLEKLAQNWVNRCIFEHPDPSKYPEYTGTGQNLAKSWGMEFTMVQFAEIWYNEHINYTYDNNSCKGPTCGHYTKVLGLISIL